MTSLIRRSALIPRSVVLTAGILAAWCFVPVAECQEYTPPGSLTEIRLPRRDGIAKGLKEARWKLGGLRLDPTFSIQNLSYVRDVFVGTTGPEVNDITGSVSVGLRAYLPVGRATTLAAYALPEYVWWRDQKDRRQLIGRYGGGVFTYFNRLTLELAAASHEEQNIASNEFTQLVVSKLDQVEGVLAIRAVQSLWLTASVRDSRRRYDLEGLDPMRVPAFDRLDRDETVGRFGARVTLARSWIVGAGIETSKTDFADPGFNRSSSGDSPYLTLQHDRGRHRLLADVVDQSLEPEPGSDFVAFDELTGSLLYELELRPAVTASVYSSRQLAYSLTDAYAYSLSDRTGVGLALDLGRLTRLNLSAEQGEERYSAAATSTAPARSDDYTGFSAQLQVRLRPRLSLLLGFSRAEFDSNLDVFDRSFDQLTTSVSVRGLDWP